MNSCEYLDAGKFVQIPEQWPWTQEDDGLNAAPENHRILFENEMVQIVEISIQPGEKEEFHTHEKQSIMIVDSPADMRYFGADKNVKFQRSFDKQQPQVTTISWREPEGLHAIENIDTKAFHGIRIFFKK